MIKKEVEIRFPVTFRQYKQVLDLLKTYGKNLKISTQKDVYFCHSSYIESKRTKETPYIIRVRETDESAELAYKSFQREGSWIEIETKISDSRSVIKILKFLEHLPYLIIKKNRVSTKINLIEINADKIKSLGYFIELEKKGKNFNKNRNELIKFASEKLKIKKIEILDKGYVQLMEEKISK